MDENDKKLRECLLKEEFRRAKTYFEADAKIFSPPKTSSNERDDVLIVNNILKCPSLIQFLIVGGCNPNFEAIKVCLTKTVFI